jgi:hypothetical protein
MDLTSSWKREFSILGSSTFISWSFGSAWFNIQIPELRSRVLHPSGQRACQFTPYSYDPSLASSQNLKTDSIHCRFCSSPRTVEADWLTIRTALAGLRHSYRANPFPLNVSAMLVMLARSLSDLHQCSMQDPFCSTVTPNHELRRSSCSWSSSIR